MGERPSKPKIVSFISKTNTFSFCTCCTNVSFTIISRNYNFFCTLFAPHLFTLSQCWSVPVGGLQVEPEQLRIPADRTGSGTVTTGGQRSLTLNLSLSFASLLFYAFYYLFSLPLALILLSHNHLFLFLLFCLLF